MSLWLLPVDPNVTDLSSYCAGVCNIKYFTKRNFFIWPGHFAFSKQELPVALI